MAAALGLCGCEQGPAAAASSQVHATTLPEVPAKASAAAAQTAPTVAATGLAIRPDSTVVLVESPRRIAAIGADQKLAWRKEFPKSRIVGTPRSAPNSAVFVLTEQHVHAISAEGASLFELAHGPWFDGGKPELYVLAPAPNSMLVVCDGRHTCVAVDQAGKQLWRYRLPKDETLVGPPAVAPDSSLYLRTATTLYVVGADGKERASTPIAQAPSQ